MSAWWGDLPEGLFPSPAQMAEKLVNGEKMEKTEKAQELELSKFREGQTAENARSITPEDLESLKALVGKRQIIAEALSQRMANLLDECKEYMKIIEFLDPEYAKRLKELNKFWDTED